MNEQIERLKKENDFLYSEVKRLYEWAFSRLTDKELQDAINQLAEFEAKRKAWNPREI